MSLFHFIRPAWLLALLPVLVFFILVWRQMPVMQSWQAICDDHLLKHLLLAKGQSKRHSAIIVLFAISLLMIIALAGPTWTRLPVPTYKQIQPKVIILDMSDAMLDQDLTPDRLSRAKFKLHDLFTRKNTGQYGLLVYSGEPFVVSPITDDGDTIDTLLSSLTQDIMPVQGQRLDTALKEAVQLFTQAGFSQGEVLILTPEAPSTRAISEVKNLASTGIHTSIIPIRKASQLDPAFQALATAGNGLLLPFSDTSSDIDQWLMHQYKNQAFTTNLQENIPEWRDEGRRFLIPALFLMLLLFRRDWLQRISS